MAPTPDHRMHAQALKALADETRLRIMTILMDRGETCVCEFLELLGGTTSNLSFHLTKLKNAGLIADRKVGKWMLYRPDVDGLRTLHQWLSPLIDPARVPRQPASDSMARLCDTSEPPLSLSDVQLRRRGRRVVVTTKS